MNRLSTIAPQAFKRSTLPGQVIAGNPLVLLGVEFPEGFISYTDVVIHGSIDLVGSNPTPGYFINGQPVGGGGASGVETLNGLAGDVVLEAGSNITLTPSGQTITIRAVPSGANGQFQLNDAGSFDAGNLYQNPDGSIAANSNLTVTGDVTSAGNVTAVNANVTGGYFVNGAALSFNAVQIGLSPQISTWTTVQQAIAGLESSSVPSTRQVIAGANMSGGGALSADVTLNAVPSGAAGQVQFHNGAAPPAFGASANLTWDNAAAQFKCGGDIFTTGAIWMDAIQVNLGSPVTVQFAVATPPNSGVGINLGSINSISTVTGGVLTVYASTTNVNGPMNVFNGLTATWDIEVYNLSAFPANIAFVVDADLQRVGIRTLAPEWPLDVDGDAGFRRNVMATNLPTAYPGVGSKQFWADPADGYTVKWAV